LIQKTKDSLRIFFLTHSDIFFYQLDMLTSKLNYKFIDIFEKFIKIKLKQLVVSKVYFWNNKCLAYEKTPK